MTSGLLFIFGFGGHARSVADVALTCGYSKLIFIDQNAHEGELFLDFPVQKVPSLSVDACFFAASDTYLRKEQILVALADKKKVKTLISPTATRGVGAVIQTGTVVGDHAHIGPMAKIGMGSIINTAAIIEHECQVGDFSHVSVNATLAGRVTVGQHVFIGAGAVVRDWVTIGDHITIGAGAVVVHDLVEPGIYVGVPAKRRPVF